MPGTCVHHLFEAQASLTPDAVAVVSDGGVLTYRELDERAARCAQLLAEAGIGAERLVAVVMEPSPGLLVTMLAVWKAGGVYVPVDPSLPDDVAEAMIKDIGASLLVRDGSVTVAPSGVPVVDLEQVGLSDRPTTAPPPAVDPSNLAYCVFTSGSTGKPKPVAVTHASFANHAVSLRDELKLVPSDRFLQSTPIAFDAALEEIMPAWVTGAAVVMPDQRHFTSLEFTELIDRLAVTGVSLPSAYWHQWVDDLTSGLVSLPASLRIVFIGGDKILVDKLAAWYRIPGAESIDWVSDYGPTEASISVALYRPEPDELSGPGRSDYALAPIGRPFAQATFHILDDDMRPVPDGTPGDIWLAGPPLARGYHAAPAATADRFLPDPQGPPGSRMYRTGDRGSRRSDGTLLFLGRSDRQVKVRGHRVEPGQVESAMHHCAGVRDVVVISVEDPPFGSRLIAYVEAEDGVSEAAIRADISGRLSEAVVPRSIVLLDRIPRSPLNGKAVRSALPPVAPPHADDTGRADRTGQAGMTTLERVVALLVSDVLGGRSPSRDEDFFAAGGDSLRGLQLLSRVADVTGVGLSFAQLRMAPHVAGVAALVKRAHGRDASESAVVPSHERDDRCLASRGQQALWFLDRVHRGAPTYAVVLGYRIRGPLDLDRLDAALTGIVARHEALRTVFEEGNGRVWQRIRPASPVRTEVTVAADADKAGRLAEEEARRPFDLSAGPLLRSACYRVDAEDHLWLLNVHHAVFDAWSLAVFWREFAMLYAGRPLPEPTIQYADYCAWQERWLRGAEAEGQRDHWRARLEGDPPAVEPGLPRGSGKRSGTEGFALPLPPEAVDPTAVERVARACGSTAFTVLLAAFLATLRRTGGVDDVVVGVPMAGRNRPGTEDLIGYLVNTVPLRMRFTAGMTFRELVGRTDEALAEALTHQELPLADVVASLPRRAGGQRPLFHAMFALQSTPLDIEGGIEGLDIAEQFIHQGTAKAALTWSVRQHSAGLAGEVEYAADRFDQTSARGWQNTLLTLLAGGLADPGARLDELPVPTGEGGSPGSPSADQ
ncbi:non-ribosomal peptide synthetase [Streptomyces radicis]|uniref:Amino acid adenylation domain-containing protein n=1 Tax=Streptomyces radicis TaxID=1750517 RepID=A0A3A9W2Y3_9ACTN|nr:non-ribosomal peptide synthetase [Streptomyces radicis]RKN07611.1 amino acid adenylation domain-containing protein [Streptomyces radicis]RKN18334.1 amino acid adenylation domain-containing protein [Streptomyces radicis]